MYGKKDQEKQTRQLCNISIYPKRVGCKLIFNNIYRNIARPVARTHLMPQPIQTMPEGWIFQAIWKHHAEARAKVCVPDTVLIKDGAPYRWLFTSRQGTSTRRYEHTITLQE